MYGRHDEVIINIHNAYKVVLNSHTILLLLF